MLLLSSEISVSYQKERKIWQNEWNKEFSLLTTYSVMQGTARNVAWTETVV